MGSQMFFQAFDAHSVCFDIDVFTLFLESVKGKSSENKQQACSVLKSLHNQIVEVFHLPSPNIRAET